MGLALLLAAAGAAADKKEPAFDAAKMVGDWTYVSGVRGGAKVDPKDLVGPVKITKDRITVPSEDKDKPYIIAYTINAKETPAQIDMEIKDGPVKDIKAEGVIGWEGDELKLAYVVAGEGKKRPDKLESTKDNGAFFFVLKKAK
jgi:uncharacterized protein (TIGR03067 family)